MRWEPSITRSDGCRTGRFRRLLVCAAFLSSAKRTELSIDLPSAPHTPRFSTLAGRHSSLTIGENQPRKTRPLTVCESEPLPHVGYISHKSVVDRINSQGNCPHRRESAFSGASRVESTGLDLNVRLSCSAALNRVRHLIGE